MKIEGKLDGSPVTEADLAADRIIGDGLARLIPDVPALSEERVAAEQAALSRQLLSDRPARRNQGVRRRPRRIYGHLALVTNGTPLLGIIGAAGAWMLVALIGRPRRRAPGS